MIEQWPRMKRIFTTTLEQVDGETMFADKRQNQIRNRNMESTSKAR